MMTNPIDNWTIPLEGYSDDRLGLAGTMFETCASLFRLLVRGPAERSLEAEPYRALRTQAQKFALWGDGFDTKHGGLDTILAESKHLRKTVIYLLNSCGICLAKLAGGKLSAL
jgi:hypothetical protein